MSVYGSQYARDSAAHGYPTRRMYRNVLGRRLPKRCRPALRAMALRCKSLAVTDVLVDDILDLSYGGKRTFAVLAMLYDQVDTRNQFHVDPVLPKAQLDPKRLREPEFSREEIEALGTPRDRFANRQLLPGPENIDKSATAPDEWAARTSAPPMR